MIALVAVAFASPDADQLRAYLDWHCSADNVPRYSGAVVLAPAPDGVPDTVAVPGFVEVGTAGLVGDTPGDGPIAVDAATPVAVVADAFRRIAEARGEGTAYLVLRRGGSFAPAPLPPDADRVLPAVAALRASIEQDPTSGLPALSVRLHAAVGRCHALEDLLAGPSTCADTADALRRTLRCGADPVEVLALWTLIQGHGEGQPYMLVQVDVRGADVLPAEGTWATAAPAFLASASPALVAREGPPPPPPGPPKVFHHSLHEVRKRILPEWPASAPTTLGEQRCTVRLRVLPDGHPADVAVDEACPPELRAAAGAAAARWRWYRPTAEALAAEPITAIALTLRPPAAR